MTIHAYIIGDSPEHGDEQVISRTYAYPWVGCKVADEVQDAADKAIREGIEYARANGYANLQEVCVYYKQVFYPKWGMVDHKEVKRITRPLKIKEYATLI